MWEIKAGRYTYISFTVCRFACGRILLTTSFWEMKLCVSSWPFCFRVLRKCSQSVSIKKRKEPARGGRRWRLELTTEWEIALKVWVCECDERPAKTCPDRAPVELTVTQWGWDAFKKAASCFFTYYITYVRFSSRLHIFSSIVGPLPVCFLFALWKFKWPVQFPLLPLGAGVYIHRLPAAKVTMSTACFWLCWYVPNNCSVKIVLITLREFILFVATPGNPTEIPRELAVL